MGKYPEVEKGIKGQIDEMYKFIKLVSSFMVAIWDQKNRNDLNGLQDDFFLV